MANPYIWAGLERATNDPTTIDAAIAEAITAHDDDPEAHLGPDQSLQSHRASEIIDHLAESVVNDKIKRTARRYVAIVDPNSPSDFDTVEQAVAYAKDVGGGDIFMTRGTHFLSADILCPPTIGFYGNGIGETTLKSNSTTKRNINFYVNGSSGEGYGTTMAAYNGQNWLPYDPSLSGYANPVPNMVLTQYDSPNKYYLVDHFDDAANRLYLTTTISGMVDDGEFELSAGFEFVDGSSECILHTNTDIADANYFPGMSINDFETGGRYRTIALSEDGVFTLAEPYSGTNVIDAANLQYYESSTINFGGLTFDWTTNKVGVGGQAGNSTVYAESVQNLRLMSSSGLGVGATYIGCVFDCDNIGTDPTTIGVGAGVTLINCVFRATTNAARGVRMGEQGRVIGCKFLANGFTNHDWLDGNSADFLLLGNLFESQDGKLIFALIGSGTTGSGKIMGNHFTFENNKTLTMQIKRAFVTNNKFIFSGSGVLAFNNASLDNIVTQNNVVGDITDAGTGNIIKDNRLTSGGQRVVAATSDTAMALRWRESVQLTPNSTRTLTTTVAPAGQRRTLIILTSGTTSYTLTFGTGFKTTGTLVTGTVSARYFVIEFMSDGTNMIETSRTSAIA